MNNNPEYSFDGHKGPGKGKNKCNYFVDDVLDHTGAAPRRHLGFGGPIRAGDWANSNFDISNFPVVNIPQPGDVVAIAHSYADASGPVAIVVEPCVVDRCWRCGRISYDRLALGRKIDASRKTYLQEMHMQPMRTRNYLKKFIILAGASFAFLAVIYFIYPKIILECFAKEIPSKWSPDLGNMNFTQIYQKLGMPQDDASAKDYQNWLEYHWWGAKMLKIISPNCCDANAKPNKVIYLVTVNGWYEPIYRKDIVTGNSAPDSH